MSDLTLDQQKLADMLIETKTQAKVRRRKQNPDGSYEFFHIIRKTSPVDFSIDSSEFAFVYHEKNPSAPLSPIIINLRNLPENLVTRIAAVLAEVKLKQTPQFCTGIPNAATSFAKEYSKLAKIPYVTIFEKDDNPGKPRILPAKNAPKGNGKTLLIVDDVITKGASKFRAFQVAEELGYKIVGLLVLVDRDEGGRETLEKAGYNFYAPISLLDLLKYCLDKAKINMKQYKEVIKYLEFSKQI